MITCFGARILVSLLALCSLHKKRGTQCKGTLQNSCRCVGWRGLGGFVLHGHSSPFSLPPYYSPSLPPSLLSTSQLAESPEVGPRYSPPCFFTWYLCRSINISWFLSFFKPINKHTQDFHDINRNPSFPAVYP